jgi:pimeloyl-ACP methyl ester carboxylesterase
MPGIGPLRAELPAAGLQVHGLRAGQGTPLLLLHGWPEWSHAWRPVMSRLLSSDSSGQARFELVAPDLRGFGNTQPPSLAPSGDAGAERHANDLLELVRHLGWQRFGVVAHDVGSFVAQALARLAPQRLTGLFFFNCAYPGIGARWASPRHLGEIWYQAFHQQPWAAALVGSSREACSIYLRHFLQHWSHQPAWIEGELEHWVDHFLQPGRLQGGFNWYTSAWPSRLAVIEGRAPALPPINVPTRVLWGAHDPVLKAEWGDRLPEFFSDLRFDVLPDAGHFVHLEQPDVAAAQIERFFISLC